MKKLVIAYMGLALIILTSCTVNGGAPGASPSKEAVASSTPTTAAPMKSPTKAETPTAAIIPTPKQSFKLTNEAANAYLKTISDVIDSQLKLQKVYSWKYDDDEYSGALYDLDSDGQDELYMAYFAY